MADSRLDGRVVATAPSAASLRERRLARGIAASLGSRAIGLIAPVLMVSVTFGYLGAQRYGLWMAATSLTSMALFADLGLGNGLMTRLSRCYATGDHRTAALTTASGYAALSAQAGLLLLALLAAGRFLPWAALFNVDDPILAGQASTVVGICFGSFLINIPCSLIQRVQYSQQQIALSNIWQAAGSVACLGLAFLAVHLTADPRWVIAAAVAAVPAVNLLNTMTYFAFENPALRPRWANIDRATAGNLIRLGLRFFVLSLLASVAMNIDGLLVARTLGLGAAAHYSVVAKLFTAAALFVTLVCLPLWPANAEALARGEVAWVRRNTRRMSLLSAGAVTTGCLVLFAFGERLLSVWLGTDEVGFATPRLLAALGLTCVIVAATAPLFMVQNSIGLLGPQLVGWGLFLVLSISLKAALLRRFGLVGLPVATSVSYVVALVPAAWIGYRRSLASTAGEVDAVAIP